MPGGDPRTWLLEGFQAAHHRIQEYADKYPDLHGMGTTCTAMALLDHQLYFSHVGDSRLYLVRGATISRLTHDHSYVSRLVENGVLRAEEAESHPQRHILTAALGAGASVTPDCPAEPVSSSPEMCWCYAPMVCGVCSPKPKSKARLPGKPQLKSATSLSIPQKARRPGQHHYAGPAGQLMSS